MRGTPERPTVTDASASTLARYKAVNADFGAIAQALGPSVLLDNYKRSIVWRGSFNTELRLVRDPDGSQAVEVLSDYDPTTPSEYADHTKKTGRCKFSGTPETVIVTKDGCTILLNNGFDDAKREVVLIRPDGFLENTPEVPGLLSDVLAEIRGLPRPPINQAQAAAIESPIAAEWQNTPTS
jgi:hypothetical protein